MSRPLLVIGLMGAACLAFAQAVAAQVAAPTSPTATRSGSTLSPVPRTTPPTPPVTQPVPARPAQPVVRPTIRPPVDGPIRSDGPAQVVPAPRTTAPAKVYDRDGRIIPGVRPAGQNRVFDSRTGRYHDSVPQGADSRIKP